MEENQLPPGFRFHPTDEELITYYLSSKVSDYEFTTKAVADVDLNKCEPWDLPGKASMGEKEWYFFSLRDRKYPTGLRTNRATEAGYWKTTGKDKEIFQGGSGALAGMKKTLVFYRGRAPKGEKTNWVMHEYRLQNTLPFKPAKDEWVVCRVFQKSSIIKRPPPSSPCDDAAAMANELQNFSMPMSPSANNMMALQHYNTTDHTNMMNGNEANSLTWPLLSTNLSINSLLLTALHLRGHHHHQLPVAENYSFVPQGNMDHQFNTNFNMGSTSSVPQPPLEEQHYNVDSNIW